MKNKIAKILIQVCTVTAIVFCLSSSFVFAQVFPACPPGQVMIDGVCYNTSQTPDIDTPLPNSPAGNDATNQPQGTGANPTTLNDTNSQGSGNIKNDYTLLAPLDGLEVFDTAQKCAFTEYMNKIIKLFIGICAVLAMVMIVIGGIGYMTSELVSSKENGKTQMTQAVLGLLIALGAWLILNEINPNLLNLCFDKLPKGTPVLQNEQEVYSAAGESGASSGEGVSTAQCKEGMEQAVGAHGSMWVCSRIVNSVNEMLIAAEKNTKPDGTPFPIKLSGSGYRTKQRQIELRMQNCGTSNYDIYEKPSGACDPDTAIPGRSRHENGLALDLRCDGTQINKRDNHCFLWLKENAWRYRLKNKYSEPWHWSVDGH